MMRYSYLIYIKRDNHSKNASILLQPVTLLSIVKTGAKIIQKKLCFDK